MSNDLVSVHLLLDGSLDRNLFTQTCSLSAIDKDGSLCHFVDHVGVFSVLRLGMRIKFNIVYINLT